MTDRHLSRDETALHSMQRCKNEKINLQSLRNDIPHITGQFKLHSKADSGGVKSAGQYTRCMVQKWKTGTERQYFTDIMGLS